MKKKVYKMVDIRRLDPNKINARGYYADLSSTSMFLLTDEEIREARRFFRRPDLAKDRKISKQTYQSYKCQRTSPKSPSRIRIPKKLVPVALIGGTVIAISVGFVGNLKSSHEYLDPTMNVQAALKSEIVTVDPEEPITVVLEPTSSLDEVSELVTNPTTPSIPTSSVLEEKEEESIEAKRERWVHHFCDIYQVDFDIVYQKLVEVTNNFTNDDYLHGHIP